MWIFKIVSTNIYKRQHGLVDKNNFSYTCCPDLIPSPSMEIQLVVDCHCPIHGGDTSWPKQFQNGGPQAIYETLLIEYWIVYLLRHISYTFIIWASVSNAIETGILKDFVYEMCISSSIAYVILMSWPLMAIYFLL